MECVAVGPEMEEESGARGRTDGQTSFQSSKLPVVLVSRVLTGSGENALKTRLYFLTSSQRGGNRRLAPAQLNAFLISSPFVDKASRRLPVAPSCRRGPPSNGCSGRSDDLLTRGV